MIEKKELTKGEINLKIADLLGFKKEKYSKDLDVDVWTYPEEWRSEVCAHPMTAIPDFVTMIKNAKDIKNMYANGLPRYFPFLDKETIS